MNEKYLKIKHDGILYKMKTATKLEQVPANSFILGQNYSIEGNDKLFKFLHTNNEYIYHQYIKNHANNNLFELLNKDIRKVYFDIDFEKDEPSINRTELNSFITAFISRFNVITGESVKRDDLIVLVRKEEYFNKFRSIHIIIKNLRINYLILKDIVNNWLGDINGIQVDGKVYTKNREFCLRHQTKTKYNYKRVFIDFDKKNKNVKENLIDNTENTEVVKNIGGMKFLQSVYKEAVKNIIVNGGEEVNNKIEERLTYNQPRANAKDTIKVNKYNLVKSIVDLLPSEFYLDEKEWKYFTSQIVFHYIDDIKYWCEKSADYSNDKYTTDDNLEFVSRADRKYRVFNFSKKVINRLNMKYNLKLLYSKNLPYDTPQSRWWISQLTDTDIDDINIIFINHGELENRTKYITINDDWKFNTDTYLLVNNQSKKTYQYWNEYYKFTSESKKEINDNFIIFDTKEEVEEKTQEFMDDDDKRLIAISMKWGMGKSWFCMRKAIEMMIESGGRVLLITENNTLNNDVYLTYKNIYGDCVSNHLKLKQDKRNNFNENDKIVICSQESIKKLNGNKFDLVLLDEYESLLNHYESTTFKKITPFQSIEILEKKLVNAKKIILLDADLSMERILPMVESLKINNYNLYYCFDNKWSSHQFNIYNNAENKFINKLIDDLNDNKKIALGSQSKTWCENLERYIKMMVKRPINIFTIWSDEIKVNGERIPKKSLEKIEDIIITNKIDLWIYSPSVKTGLSFNGKHFNKTYIRANEMSCCGREAIQMFFRVRELTDKEINVSLPKIQPPKDIPSNKQIYDYLVKNIGLPYNPKRELRDADTNEFKFKLSPLYESIKISNIIESFKSMLNLPHEILERLTQNHSIDLNYIDIDDNPNELIKYNGELKLLKCEIDNEKINRLVETPLINRKELKRLINKQEHGIISIDEEDKIKKRLLLDSTGWSVGDYHVRNCGLVDDGFIKREYKLMNGVIERNDKIGKEYFIEDGKIDWTYIDYTDTIKNNTEVITSLYESNIEEKSKLINFNNNYIEEESEEQENAINRKNRLENVYKIVYSILKEFYGDLIYQNDGTIKHDNFKVNTKMMKEMIFKTENHIKENYNYYESVLFVKKKFMDWSKFNSTNQKHRKEFIKWNYDILSRIGYSILSPKNLNRDNEFYTIKRDDNIYKPYQYDERETPIIKDIEDKDISIMVKTGKIKIKKTKTWLYRRSGNRWSNGKIIGKITTIKDYEDKQKIIKTDTEMTEEKHKEIMKNLLSDPLIGKFYSRKKYHVKNDNSVIINKYYYPVRKEIQEDDKKCLIDSDDDDDNDFESPLDKNIEK